MSTSKTITLTAADLARLKANLEESSAFSREQLPALQAAIAEHQASIRKAHEILREFALSKAPFAETLSVRSVLEQLRPFLIEQPTLGRTLRESLSAQFGNEVVSLNSQIQRFFGSPQFNALGDIVGQQQQSIKAMLGATAAYSHRHARYLKSGVERHDDIDESLRVLPTTGLYVHAQAVTSFSPNKSAIANSVESTSGEDVASFLETNLALLDPAYARQYLGMKAAAHSQRPDWETHAGSSARKLVKGVLHRIAPDDIVLPWAMQHGQKLDEHGRPTRKTKIRWICARIANPQYARVLSCQLEANLAVIRVLDESQHEDDLSRFAERFDRVERDVEQLVSHLLRVWLVRGTGN